MLDKIFIYLEINTQLWKSIFIGLQSKQIILENDTTFLVASVPEGKQHE